MIHRPPFVGALLPRMSSSSSEPAAPLTRESAEWLMLIGLGLLAVTLRASVNLPLKLPGHHGLEWMAILMFARVMSDAPRAATVVAGSAAALSWLPVWGFHAGGMEWGFLLSGLVVDGGWRVLRARATVALALLAAAAHGIKPLFKYALVLATGAQFGSLESGFAYPLVCHLLYGVVGGAVGVVAGKALREARA